MLLLVHFEHHFALGRTGFGWSYGTLASVELARYRRRFFLVLFEIVRAFSLKLLCKEMTVNGRLLHTSKDEFCG